MNAENYGLYFIRGYLKNKNLALLSVSFAPFAVKFYLVIQTAKDAKDVRKARQVIFQIASNKIKSVLIGKNPSNPRLIFLPRNFDRFDNVRNHRVGRRAVQFGFGAKGKAMSQNGKRNVAHVVRRRKIAPANRR